MGYDIAMMQLLSNATPQRKGVGTAFGYHGNKASGGDSDPTLLIKKAASDLGLAEVYEVKQILIYSMSLVLASIAFACARQLVRAQSLKP